MYADDTQILLSFALQTSESQAETEARIENCILELRSWMRANHLKLNDDKTELLVFNQPQQQVRIQDPKIIVGDIPVGRSSSARDLGVILDSAVSMESQVSLICRTAYHHLRNIRSIRKSLDLKTTEMLIHASVTSRLDCGNAILIGLPKHLLSKLQAV